MKGHIRERSPGHYAVILDLADPATGKRRRKWHSFTGTKREAQVECARLIAQLQGGFYAEPSRVTVAEFLDRWLEHIRSQVSPKSHERYSEIAKKNIAPLLGRVALTKLTPIAISKVYANALTSGRRDGKGGLSPRTVHHMHRILKQALRQAMRWQMLTRNPADATDPPKVERKRLETYDIAQTAALIEALRGSRMFVPAILAVLCGLRRGEILALRWRNVDLTAGTLSVVESAEQTKTRVRYKEPKSGRGRNVALPETAIQELKAWRLRQAEELFRVGERANQETFVVTQTDGTPIQPRSLTHEWVRLSSKTSLPRIRFHDLRHAHATHLLASGVHPKVASERLGHSKVGITLDLYSHVMPGMQEDAAARVDAALQAAMNGGKRP
jgi:integrase